VIAPGGQCEKITVPRERPELCELISERNGYSAILVKHRQLQIMWWYVEGQVSLLFAENDINTKRLFGISDTSPYVKDSINDAVVNAEWEYPWFAAWDLAFHMIPVAMIDPEWAKR
jgi:hypothetical protein